MKLMGWLAVWGKWVRNLLHNVNVYPAHVISVFR